MEKAKKLLEGLALTCLFGFMAGLMSFGNPTFGSGRPVDGLAAIFQTPVAAAGEPESAADKTLSPYFFVKSDNPDLDQLPLKSTAAEVNVAGVIADVKVTQVYKNEGKRALEALYIFPASTRAAVYGMKMTIGERVIVAKIQKREEARAAYEQAKKEGKSASLLEQQRPNVFQMNVANILPGDEIKTELSYTELLTPTDGVYEFVYPTVVGPRYSNQKAGEAPSSEKWVANPYLHEKEKPSYTFDLALRLAAGMPIQEMACTSHTVDIRYEDPSRAVVSLASSEKTAGNKDFILKYRLAGDKIESGLLLYQGEDENFFLLMAQPPKRVSPAAIPPREYIFIVDVSGSMNGFPLEISKKLLKDLIGGLKHTDTFNVLLFSGGSKLLSERSLSATPENVRTAIDLLERQSGGGGTELLPALQRALALPRSERSARTMIIVTDGFVSVETQAFDLIREHLGDASFFSFGIGTSVNRFLIEGMAHAGAGEPFIVTSPTEAPARAEKLRQYIQSPVLTRIKLEFDGFQAYDIEPASVPDVFAERPVVVFGKWRGQPKGTISLKGISGERNYEKTLAVESVKPLTSNAALRSLWARSVITRLSDYNSLQKSDKRIGEVTDLGLKYSLLTAYTSFVAVDSEVRRKEGDLATVNQPLPLPEGVSDNAVGAGAPRGALGMSKMSRPSAPPSGSMQYSQAPATEAPSPGATSLAEKAKPSQPAGGKYDASEKETAGGIKDEKSREEKDGDKSDRKIELDKLSVAGGLSQAAVRRTIEENMKEILDCLPKELKAGSREKVTVKWTINAEGKVVDVKIVSTRSGTKAIEKCLVERIGQWRFDVPSGTAATAGATFLFEPLGK